MFPVITLNRVFPTLLANDKKISWELFATKMVPLGWNEESLCRMIYCTPISFF